MAAAEIAIFSDTKPKHKVRRRARHPRKSDEMDGSSFKPISLTKPRKMAEKDRHTRIMHSLTTYTIHFLNIRSPFSKEIYVDSLSYLHLSVEEFRKQAVHVTIFKEHGDTADVSVSF